MGRCLKSAGRGFNFSIEESVTRFYIKNIYNSRLESCPADDHSLYTRPFYCAIIHLHFGKHFARSYLIELHVSSITSIYLRTAHCWTYWTSLPQALQPVLWFSHKAIREGSGCRFCSHIKLSVFGFSLKYFILENKYNRKNKISKTYP